MRSVKSIVGCLVIGAFSLSAMGQNQAPPPHPAPGTAAQPAPGGPRPVRGEQPGRGPSLSPEKAKAAWDVEATGVSKRLGLDDAKAKEVAKVYAEARTGQEAAIEKVRKDMEANGGGGGGGPRGGPEMMKAIQEATKTEREKLTKALSGIMSADQASKAGVSLGAFSRQWDTMADTISEFKLDAAKQQDALNAVEDYVVAQAKMLEQIQSGDRDAARTAAQESRQKMMDGLKKVLSEEQVQKFEAATGRGGGRGRGPGGPGGGGGGGAGGGGKDGGGK